MLTGKMCMQHILPITVPVKEIKGAAAHQCYSDGDRVGRCVQTFTHKKTPALTVRDLCFMTAPNCYLNQALSFYNMHWG